MCFTFEALNYFFINHGGQRVYCNLKSSQMSSLVLSDSFEYLCDGSTAIIIFYSYSAGIDFRRQILTTKVDPRAIRVKRRNLQMFGL